MKKTYFVMLLIPFIFFVSCNDNFNINAPQQDIYVLNCILRNDQSIQYATISKDVYTENGVPPASNGIIKNIKGADIQIFYKDSVFVMRDTTIQLSDSGNVSEFNCYYVKNLTINTGDIIRIEASIPGGQKLSSTVQGMEYSFSKVSLTFPPSYENVNRNIRYNYGWSWRINSGVNINVLNLPELEIYYKKYEAGNLVAKKILVPLAKSYYQTEEGSLLPLIIDQLSYISSCFVTPDIVKKTMLNISGDDPNKQNYIINKVIFNVTGLDTELAKYYMAYNTHKEDFTIKVRQTDYSDIKGGKGIFGVYYKFTKSLIIDSSYISSFGYQFDPL